MSTLILLVSQKALKKRTSAKKSRIAKFAISLVRIVNFKYYASLNFNSVSTVEISSIEEKIDSKHEVKLHKLKEENTATKNSSNRITKLGIQRIQQKQRLKRTNDAMSHRQNAEVNDENDEDQNENENVLLVSILVVVAAEMI